MKTYKTINPGDADILYEYRGAFSVNDRAKREEDFVHESFARELSKQLTPQITAALGYGVTFLKRHDMWIRTNQFAQSPFYFHGDSLYMHLDLSVSCASTFLWVKCTSLENGGGIDPRADIAERKLKFKIVYDLPLEIREKAYASWPDNAIKKMDPKIYKQIEYWRNLFFNNMELDRWIAEIKEWLPPPKPVAQEPKLRFEYEIIGSGWPDVLIRLYMKKPVTIKIKEQVMTLLAEFLQSWNEGVERRGGDEVIHDMFLHESDDGEENDTERAMLITIFVDFGNADPCILEQLLRYINDNNLNIEKIIFS